MVLYSIRYIDRPAGNIVFSNEDDGEEERLNSSSSSLPIVLDGSYQSRLVAMFNALLLLGKIGLPSHGMESIEASDMMRILSNYAFEYGLTNPSDGVDVIAFVKELKEFLSADNEVPAEHSREMFHSVGLQWWFFDSVTDRRKSYYPSILPYQPLTPCGYNMITETMMTIAAAKKKRCATDHQYPPISIVSFGRRYFVLTMIKRQKFAPDFYVLLGDPILLHNNSDYDFHEILVWKQLDQIYNNSHRYNITQSRTNTYASHIAKMMAMTPSTFVASPYVDSNFEFIKTRNIPPRIRPGLTDFTKPDLDWMRTMTGSSSKTESSTGSTHNIIEHYRLVLGYTADDDDLHAKPLIVDPNNIVDLNNIDRNKASNDEDYARRVQQQFIEEDMNRGNSTYNYDFGGASNSHNGLIGGETAEIEDDLAAAIALSMKDINDTTDNNTTHEKSANTGTISNPNRLWNLDLIIGLEVRSKYYMNRYMSSERGGSDDENRDWEIWSNKGSNVLRSASSDTGMTKHHEINVQNPADLYRHYGNQLADRVQETCAGIMEGKVTIIPDSMRETAEIIATEELLLRIEEHKRLVVLLQHIDSNVPAPPELGKYNLLRPPDGDGSRSMEDDSMDRRLSQHWKKPMISRAGKEIINRCVRTFSDEAQEFYQADVVQYDENTGKHLLLYQHGLDEVWKDLKQEDWQILDEEAEQFIIRRKNTRISNSSFGDGGSSDFLETQLIIIQARWRGYTTRNSIIALHNAVTKIQTMFRAVSNKSYYAKKRTAITRINAVIRGFLDRGRYGDTIAAAYNEWKRVHEPWKSVVDLLAAQACAPETYYFSWQHLKKTTLDISHAGEQDKETTDRINEAQEGLLLNDESERGDIEEVNVTSNAPSALQTSSVPYQDCEELLSNRIHSIMLSQASLKWFKNADSKYKGFFLKRMRQFSTGEYERSFKLRKRLTGCKHIIYEAYLEQKVAYRILFTECKIKDESNGKMDRNSILVWYVSTHDRVSRYIRQIDEAEARMNRQFKTSAAHLFNNNADEAGSAMILDNDTILLDPTANTPLKIHQLPSSDIDKLELEAWTPPFRLTNDEKKIVQTKGTVLVLGRSGTGKTVCIVNRMVFDADFYGIGAPLKQLFISRSHRIKDLVKGLLEDAVNDESRSDRSFLSYLRMLRDVNAALTKLGFPVRLSALKESDLQRGFLEFKADFFLPIKKDLKTKLTALVIWTQIRSFIKGSIEAVMHGRPLTAKEYLELGAKYCRLNKEQREEAYRVYEKYCIWLEANGYYDSCDKTIDVLNRIQKVSLEARSENNIHFDKIYVDECQDFTASDIALFWTLCQGGDLFLAGDTAQSVEKGISFRFEEVKRVFYEMSNHDRSRVPSSPLHVHINFRSHAGILQLAAEVLKMLHDAFPGAADKVRGDEGLFKGPRPCILCNKQQTYCLGLDALRDLMVKNPALVLLTPDDNVQGLKEKLRSTDQDFFILGICEAKGLDFDEVIICDFFSASNKQSNLAWKNVLSTSFKTLTKGAGIDFQESFPELEMSLKLLYTGITRCRHRLFFAETHKSQAGEAFSRWILGTNFAEKQDVLDLSVRLKSADEWRSLGVEYAINAEAQDNTAMEAGAWFKRSADCFRQANDDNLLEKTQRQAQVRDKAFRLIHNKHWDDRINEAPKFIYDCLEDGGFIDEAIEMCELLLDQCPTNEEKLTDAVTKILNGMKHARKRIG